MTTSCDKTESICGGAAAADEALEPCARPTYIESRTVYTPAVCLPRVINGGGAATVQVSTAACNLLQNTALGLFADGNVAPSADGAITFAGCGTGTSPWTPTINYSVLAAALDPNDTTAYVTNTKCGWEWSGGKLVTRGVLVTGAKSSDGSLNVLYDAADCTINIKLPSTTASSIPDAPAEIAIIEASSNTILGQKIVTVSIKNAKSGSTGSISVIPNSGAIPPAQNYTASAAGTASKIFTIDTATTTVNVVGSNSSRFLINPQASFALVV